jgi:Ni,Fe-hydrogenase III large subunit
MTCEHDIAEKEAACADGMCPICAAARAELAQIENATLKQELELAERWNEERCDDIQKLEIRIDELYAQIERLKDALADARRRFPKG